MAQGKNYTPEFREEAVRLAIESKRPIAHVARELGISTPQTLRNWVRNYRREIPDHQEPSLDLDERARMRELERRNRQLEMENSFLKKAAAYFAKDHP